MSKQPALKKRCIAEAAERMGWGDYGKYWMYPVYHLLTGDVLGTRLKAKPGSQTTAKYLWHGGKPKSPYADWYVSPDLEPEKIESLWIVNGEPALLACLEAGLENVATTTLSEIAVPKNINKFMSHFVRLHTIYFLCDNDSAGRQAAIRWRDALRERDYIGFNPLALTPDCFSGGDVPAKADANDLWIHHYPDRAAFKNALSFQTEFVLLPEYKDPEPEPRRQTSFRVENARDAVIEYFDLSGARVAASGFFVQMVTCPFHDDNNPSAGISSETGVLNCFRCGSYSPVAVADALGISWRDDSNVSDLRTSPNRPMSSAERAQLYDETVQAMHSLLSVTARVAAYEISIDREKLASVTAHVTALYRRLKNGDRVTIQDTAIINAAAKLTALADNG